jgi:transposase
MPTAHCRRRWVRAGKTPQKMVLRALIVLMAADGTPNATIAEELAVCLDTARKCRARFCANGVEGLVDTTRSGRPPVYSAGEVARVKAWACELPAQHRGLPRVWLTSDL